MRNKLAFVLILIMFFVSCQGREAETAIEPAVTQIPTPESQVVTKTVTPQVTDEQLFKAVTDNDPDALEALLGAGGNPSAVDDSGDPLLNAAIVHAGIVDEGADIVALLVDNGADVNALDKDGNALLPKAAGRIGQVEVVQILLDAGADIDGTLDGGSTELQGIGITALIEAVMSRNQEIIELLVARGADVNAAEVSGKLAPLHLALLLRQLDTVQLLLEHGADPDLFSHDVDAGTPLQIATRALSTEYVEALLEAGADVNLETSKGLTPLMLAVQGVPEQNLTELAALYLDYGADPNLTDSMGHTTLHHAAMVGKSAIIPLLIEHGAAIDQQNNPGNTALYLAAKEGQLDSVAMLIEHGAAVDVVNKQEKMALDVAEDDAVIELLQEAAVSTPPLTEELQTAKFSELEQALQAAVDAQVEAGFPGAILMVDAPDLGFSWKGAAGMADVDGEIPMEADTPFRTSGITNVMMGTLVLRLAEEGVLGLDDPISQHLDAAIIEQLNGPDGEPYGEAITVRQLLNSTSGMAGYFFAGEEDLDGNSSSDFTEIISVDRDKAWQPEEIIAYTTGNLEPTSAPGEGFVPNDLGTVLLGLIVEAATGEGLDEAYQTWLFEPLGMEQTFMVQPGDSRLEEVSHVYAVKGVDVSDFASLSWFRGDVVSTVDDLGRFMRAWADEKIFGDPASMEAMTEWVSMADAGFPAYSYGLGVMQTDFNEWDMPEVDVVFGHPSIWNGFLFYWPKHNITFTGTINQVFPLSQYGDLSGQALGNLLEFVAEE